MRRKAAVLTVLALGLPLLSMAWVPPAGAFTFPPLVLPHHGSLVVDNFTGMNLTDLSVVDDGAVMLGTAARFWGTPFQTTPVDSDIEGYAIAGGAKNVFVQVWAIPVTKTPVFQRDIRFQLFNNRGELLGAIQSASTDSSDQEQPAVAMAPNGNFTVAWLDHRGGGKSIYAQRFDSAGNKLGSEINVTAVVETNTYLTIASNPKGGFVLAWVDTRTGANQIFANILDGDGKSVTGDVQVTVGTDWVSFPSIGVDSQCRIVIAYGTVNMVKLVNDIGAQRLDATGQRLGGQFSPAGGDSDRTSPSVCIDPSDNILFSWMQDRENQSTWPELYAQKFNSAGSMVGAEMYLVNDTDFMAWPAAAYDSEGNLMVAWNKYAHPDTQVHAKYFPRAGIGRVSTMMVTADISKDCYFSGIAVDANGDFMIGYDEVYLGGSSYPRHGVIKPFLQGRELSGSVATGTLPTPAALYRWDSLSADVALGSSSGNSASFEYSVDGGLNWTALPANNSLTGAGASPLAIRARLSTLDNLTTPVLRSITLFYRYNYPPSVKLPADMTVKKNANVTIVSNATDGDPLDQFGLTYKWTQTAGKNLTLVNATGRNLSFKAEKAGTFTFRLVVNDGYNDSSPAAITVKVTESKPAAKSGFEWAIVLGAAAVIAGLVRKKRLSP
jgi:hypothetical protein